MLQLICMITMLIDHIGFIINNPYFRIIGRLAAPIYAYFIVNGIFKTSDIRKYILRIAFIGLAAQIPYMITFKTDVLNICFTWCLASIWIYFVYHRHKCITRMILILFGFVLFMFLPVEGNIYTYALIAFNYLLFFEKEQKNTINLHCAIFVIITGFIIILWSVYSNNLYYIACFWSFLIIAFFKNKRYERFHNKYWSFLWRSFYPVHLMILAVVSYGNY